MTSAPWTPTICLYHAQCNDGFGAAFAVWLKTKAHCQFIPVSYGALPPDQIAAHDDVLIVDFSYSKDQLLKLGAKAHSVVVLDHHKTAEADLVQFTLPTTLKGFRHDLSGLLDTYYVSGKSPVIAVFDIRRSGAQMAWDFMHETARPLLIDLIGDHDLWRHELPGSKETAWALGSYAHDFRIWEQLNLHAQALALEGKTILRAARMFITECLPMTRTVEIGGHFVPALNMLPPYMSEAGHTLLDEHPTAPFAATWYRTLDGDMWSLRSQDSRTAVSDIARDHGGGGHRNAAGFKTWAGRFMSDIGRIPDGAARKIA